MAIRLYPEDEPTKLDSLESREELQAFANAGWGHEDCELTPENLICMIKGGAAGDDDGEYTHAITLNDSIRAMLYESGAIEKLEKIAGD